MFYAAYLDGEYYFFTDDANLPAFRSIAAINPAASTMALAKRKASFRKGMIAAESVTGRF